MSTICCARCRAKFVISQNERRWKLSFCPSCGNIIQLWMTSESNPPGSDIKKELVDSSDSTLRYSEQDVIDVYIWTEIQRCMDIYDCTSLEQAFWEWADGNAAISGGYDYLREARYFMKVANESYARARDLVEVVELIVWDVKEPRRDLSSLVNAPVVRIPFGRKDLYATLKQKSVSPVRSDDSIYEYWDDDPLAECSLDAYGFYVDRDGRAFMPGHGWMDVGEADAQRRFMDAEDGIPWDD